MAGLDDLQPGIDYLLHPHRFGPFPQDVHLPSFWKWLQLPTLARYAQQEVAHGMADFIPKIPVGNALNALDFAPIPQSLIQQMIQKLQPPQT